MRTAFRYNIIKRWTFLLVTIGVIIVNYLSNAIPFNNVTMAELSAKYETLLTPAGYAFSIWSLIYATLLIFAFYQLKNGKQLLFYNSIFPWYIVSAFANVLWLFAFHFELLLISVVIMLVNLFALIRIFVIFYRVKHILGTNSRYFFQVPFGLYFGWISVATLVNIAVYLRSMNVNFFEQNEILIANFVIAILAILSVVIHIKKHDYLYPLVIAWGIYGISVNFADVPEIFFTARYTAIAVATIILTMFIKYRIKVNKIPRFTKPRVHEYN